MAGFANFRNHAKQHLETAFAGFFYQVKKML